MSGQDEHERAAPRNKRIRAIGVVLAAALGALILATSLFVRQDRLVQQLSMQNTRLTGWFAQIQSVLLLLADAETGQRGYLLTGNEIYLAPYRHALEELPAKLSSLDEIAAALPGVARSTRDIKREAHLKLEEVAATIRLQDTGHTDQAMALMRTDVGQRYMVELRRDIGMVSDVIRINSAAANSSIVSGSIATQRLAVFTVGAFVLTLGLVTMQILALMAAQSASEAHHRALVEDQTEFVTLSTQAGDLTYLNSSYARFFGVAEDSPHGRSLYDGLSASDRERLSEAIRSLVENREPVFVEVRVPRQGEECWIAWRHRLQRSTRKEVVIHSVGREITARKQAEAALRASEDFLRRTGRVAGVGGWELNLATNSLYWSEQTKRIHGVAANYEPQLETAVEFFAMPDRELIRQAVESGCRDGTPWDLELCLITATGRERCVRAVGEAELDAAGKPIRLVGSLQDVTERKELERRLAASEAFIRAITDSVPIRLAYFDRQQRFGFVNRTLCERFQLPRESILGRTVGAIVDANTGNMVEAHLPAALAGATQRFEYVECCGGVVQYIETQLVPDRDADGQIRGVFGVDTDITELKRKERALRDLTEVFDATPDFIAQADWKGNMLYINPAGRRLMGMSPEESLAQRLCQEFFTPETNARWLAEIIPAVKSAGSWMGETVVQGPAGQTVAVNHLVIGHRDSSGRIARYSSVLRDIARELRARNELAVQTATLQAIVDSMPAMVAVVDRQLRYRLVNVAFELWCGHPRATVVGRPIEEQRNPLTSQRTRPYLTRVLSGESVEFEREFPEAARVRHLAVTYTPLRLPDGTIDGFISSAHDITSHREENQRLQLLSERDALTGVFNRAGFEAHLKRKLEHGAGASTAVLYIDLDRFKAVNDRHGHAAGDDVLRQFAARLQALVRPTDIVARLGGDEFALVLSGIRELHDAVGVADKVVAMARSPVRIGEGFVHIGASVGAAMDADRAGWTDLVARADALAYRAKAEGGGRSAADSQAADDTQTLTAVG